MHLRAKTEPLAMPISSHACQKSEGHYVGEKISTLQKRAHYGQESDAYKRSLYVERTGLSRRCSKYEAGQSSKLARWRSHIFQIRQPTRVRRCRAAHPVDFPFTGFRIEADCCPRLEAAGPYAILAFSTFGSRRSHLHRQRMHV